MQQLDAVVFGQADAKRAIALAIYKHFLGIAANEGSRAAPPAYGRQHLLLMGPTGTGKTMLVREAAELLDIPVAFATATSLVETGYVGEQVESMVRNLLMVSGGVVARAERGIIFIDEVDKVRRITGGGRDVSGEGVQNALLPLLSGIEVNVTPREQPTRVDTRGILFVAAGAFAGIEEIVRKRIGANPSVGFAASAHADGKQDLLKLVETEDLVEFGLIPELVGRFAGITRLAEFSAADLADLAAVRGSVLARARAFFKEHGVRLDISPRALRAIADRAISYRTGARALDRVVAELLGPVEWQVTQSARPVQRVLITEASVWGRSKPRYSYAEATPPTDHINRLREAALKVPEPPRTLASQPLVPTDARNWPRFRIQRHLDQLKTMQIAWNEAPPYARAWWELLERQCGQNLRLMLEVAEQLAFRKATVAELFEAYQLSECDNLLANLHYLDFLRIKRAEDRKRTAAPSVPTSAPEKDAPF